MKKLRLLLFTIMFANFTTLCFGQNVQINEIAISPTLVWNKTTIYDIYSGARAKNKTGTALSSGINLNYSKTIYKNFYAKIGIGYFNQKFGVHRGFDFEETVTGTGLFYSTEYYSYHTLNYLGGIGYSILLSKNKSKILPKNSGVRLLAVYNIYNTYKQEFKHDGNFSGGNINPQMRKKNYSLGSSIILQAGINRPLHKNFSIGLDILLPVYNKWRKDNIFRENMDEFHGSDFLIGSSINFIYHLNKKN